MCYNMIMVNNRTVLSAGIIGLAVLILMLAFTSPAEIGPLGVLAFFTAIYIVFFSISTIIAKTFARLAFKKNNFHGKDYLYSAIFAFAPIMLLMMRSFGAIDFWTIILIVIFVFLAEFLVAKRL